MREKESVTGGTKIERDIDDLPFTMIPNALLADTSISWKAKGVISYLLGKPADWKARTKDIERHGNGGTTEVITALQELRLAGYARLERHTQKGKVIQFVLRVSNKRKFTLDKGARVDISPYAENPYAENPHLVSADVEEPVLENQYSTKKEGTNTQDKNARENKNRNKSGSAAAPVAVVGSPSALMGACAPKPPPFAPASASEIGKRRADQLIRYLTLAHRNLVSNRADHMPPLSETLDDSRGKIEEYLSKNIKFNMPSILEVILTAWTMDPSDTCWYANKLKSSPGLLWKRLGRGENQKEFTLLEGASGELGINLFKQSGSTTEILQEAEIYDELKAEVAAVRKLIDEAA